MAPFNALPREVFALIFQHIESTKQLAECRLVCKACDVPAERAMFTKQLCITNENARSLYMHLLEKPTLANLIKEIRLNCHYSIDDTAQLLRLAITPRLERILPGRKPMKDIRFYHTLAQIIRNFRVTSQQLKTIPWPDTTFANIHFQLVRLLKNSLEKIMIPPNRDEDISQHLKEFKCLSKLHINRRFRNLHQTESIIRAACNLNTINLHRFSFILEESNHTSNQRLNWMQQHVEVRQDAITLKAVDENNRKAPLIEYFLFKYPNTRHFIYDANRYPILPPRATHYIRHITPFTGTYVETSDRICARVSDIPSYTLILSQHSIWRSHYRVFAGNKNEIHLFYLDKEIPAGQFNKGAANQISSETERDRERSTRFQFRIIQPHIDSRHVTHLREIGQFATNVHLDFLNYQYSGIYLGPQPRATESKLFFKALGLMIHLEDMYFKALNDLVPVELGLSTQYQRRQLNKLEISDTFIQPGAFSTLDCFFSNINELVLETCRFTPDQTNGMHYNIHLPSTAIGTLLIASPKIHHDVVQSPNTSLSLDTFYIAVNLPESATLYFKVGPLHNYGHQVTSYEYASRPTDILAWSIHCQSITKLRFGEGDNFAYISVQEYLKR